MGGPDANAGRGSHGLTLWRLLVTEVTYVVTPQREPRSWKNHVWRITTILLVFSGTESEDLIDRWQVRVAD